MLSNTLYSQVMLNTKQKPQNHKTTLLKVVAYCRVSTDNQKEEGTINLQVNSIEEYCKGKGYDLVDIFKDEGVSGGLENRPALADLFAFLENNKDIQGVVIYKLDRLARDIVLQETFIRDFERRGIQLISTKEDFEGFDKGTRELVRGVFGLVAQYEKWVITLRLSSGRINKAKKGKYAGGGVALGYENKEKELLLTQSEAETIKTIYELKRKKYSINKIAKYLQENGYSTKRGGNWYASTISYILKNDIYKGNYAYSGLESKRSDLALL